MSTCTTCHLEDADHTLGTGRECFGCHKAARDKESPLDLGGRWVRQGATRVWVANPTPIRAPRPRRKAAAA